MTQDLKFENDTLVTGQSIQSDVEVAGTGLLFSDSDVETIRLSITWANNTSFQGCECYVIDPDGNYHYVFSAGSLPSGSGSRADSFDITAASGNFPFTQDGTWEFYLEDQMYNQCDIVEVAVFVQCTDSKMPATHSEVSWYGAGYYRGGIDLSNNANHIYTHNGASIVADTNSGGSNALSFSSSSSQRWSDGPVADYNGVSAWSVSAWVKPAQNTAFKQVIFCNHGYVRGNFQLYQNYDEFGLFLGYNDPVSSSGDSETIVSTNTNINTGDWYNVVATFDGSASPKLNMFVDGVAANVSRTTVANGLTVMPYNSFAGTAPDQTVGAMKQANNTTVHYPFDGEVDACRTVNSVYTADDITWLASGRDVAGGPVDFKAFYLPSPSVLGVFQ
jgi:hypothetical protein